MTFSEIHLPPRNHRGSDVGLELSQNRFKRKKNREVRKRKKKQMENKKKTHHPRLDHKMLA